jgi:hypothetical protein
MKFNNISSIGIAGVLSAVLVGHARLASADDLSGAEPDVRLAVDVEIDPIAFAFAGHSLHVGLGWRRFRLDLGTFAADVPEFLHEEDDLDIRVDGFGSKLDAYWRTDRTGPFAGIEVNASQSGVTDTRTGIFDRQAQLSAGVRLGWRIPLPASFYATPWVGFDVSTGSGDRHVGARTYQQSAFSVFPTIHVGRVFR